MRTLKFFGKLLLILLVLGVLLSASALLTVYFDWALWKGVLLFFALLILLVISGLLLMNISVFSKWLWHSLRRLFKFESKFKHISWQSFKKGLDLQLKRRFMPLKWFSAAPPPWYLVIDLFNSGCEQLLQDRHMAPMRTVPGSRRQGSKICRWWFFRNAMYLSVPVHYVLQNDSMAPAWRYLVRWIWLWCRPPAGVIISLSANRLCQHEATEHHALARLLRHAQGLLFKRLEKRLPVYLVMTNLQQLAGSELWLEQHDESLPSGMNGILLNSHYFERVHYQVTKAMDSIFQSLCLQRLRVLHKKRTLPDAATLRFPETIKQLQASLTNFLSPLCEKDSYMEYGVLSGIFITGQRTTPQGEVHGLFSHYLLESAIPGHQVNIRQQRVPGIWWLIRKSLQLVLCGAICFSFAHAFTQIQNDEAMVNTLQAPTKEERDYLRFTGMTDLNEQGIYRLFFTPALHWLLQDSARQYQSSTHDKIFLPGEVNRHLLQRLQRADLSQRAALITQWAAFINSEQQIAAGASLQTLNEMPEYSAALLSGHPVELAFEQLMAQRKAEYILGEKQSIPAWRRTLQEMLSSTTDLSWLLAVQIPAGSHNISLSDYWTGLPMEQPVQIPWIFTRLGETFLFRELDNLQQAAGDSAHFHQLREVFWQDYLLKRQDAWLDFARQMSLAESAVTGKNAWQDLLMSVAQRRSPYDRFMTDLARDLSTIEDEQAMPWLALLRDLQRQQAMLGHSGLLTAVARNQTLIRGKLKRYQRQSQRMAKRNRSFFSDTTLGRYKKYRDSLESLSLQVLPGPEKAARVLTIKETSATARNAPATLNSVFAAFSLWQNASAEQEETDPSQQVLWELCQGDARLLRDYIVLGAAEQLQEEWKSKVFWPLSAKVEDVAVDVGDTEKELYQHIVTFIQKNAAGLITIEEDGIVSHHWQGRVLPLTADFINYVNEYIKADSITGQSLETRKRLLDEKQQIDQQNDNKQGETEETADQDKTAEKPALLTLEGRPATANRDASVLPTGTSLSLSCMDGDQRLVNMNFNTQTQFHWTPKNCDDVVLTIIFPRFRLQKIYPGAEGLVDFVQDYVTGEHRYNINDFTGNSERLNQYRIKNITVRYQLSGQENILALQQAWKAEKKQQSEVAIRREHIDNKLNSLDTPLGASTFLSALPEHIITPWQFTGEN